MFANNNASPPAMQPPQQQMQGVMPQQQQKFDFQQIVARANFLRKNPDQQRFPNELDQLMKYITQVSHARNQQMQNGHVPVNGVGQQPQQPAPQQAPIQPPSPVSFTPDQINSLRTQIHAFKLLSRGQPVPDQVLQALRIQPNALPELEKLVKPQDTNAKIVDSAVKAAKGLSGEEPTAAVIAPTVNGSDALAQGVDEEEMMVEYDPADLPKGPFLENNTESAIYPYNAYRHPFSHLKRSADTDASLFQTRLQRLLIPSIMPEGLDAHHILAERDRYIENRMAQRIRELSDIEATLGGDENGMDTDLPFGSDGDSGPITRGSKLHALIELKALRLVEKQRATRALVAEKLAHGTLLPLNRLDFRRVKKPTIRDARMTEQLERKQRVDREKKAKFKHVEQLGVIMTHARELKEVHRTAHERMIRLGKNIQNFHAFTEKEEQKRIERISKERLKALKADDEEAYMKLIDTAKDTRITHLLRQTDAYLDSLAQAVVQQQREGGIHHDNLNFEQEEGPANESTFGAQVAAEDIQEAKSSKTDYYAVAHRISEKVTRQPGILVGGTLKEYQVKGLQWMVSLYNNKLNGILADEMGLGKTIQTISLISFLIEVKRQRGPYLVIVPLSTMTNWSGEFAKWAPSINIIAYKGNPAQRRTLQNEVRMNQFQVLLTTYEYIIKDRPHLSKTRWVHMIIDEGHRMKNTQSKLTQTLTTFYHSRYRLLLTGTPLQNNLPELWSLLNFVLPKIFNSVKSFDEWFNTPFANSGTGDKIELNEEEALLIIRRLHKVLRPFLLRRLKKDVENELPDKVEKVLRVKMSGLQSQLYKQMKKYKMIAEESSKGGKSGGVKGLSNELMQLRKICQHPFLFESVEDKVNPGGLVDEKIIRSSGKIELLYRILPKFFATGHRVLIFFQMTKVMDIMSDFLKMMGWKHLRLDGGTKTEERAEFVKLFNAKDSEYKVFILSTRAGGLGLNLQTADTVIIFDSDWNPHADLQAQDRAHRIGQTKAVLILRFVTEKSVEEAMYQRARYKLDIDDKVIQAGRFDNKSTQEEQEEFLRLILEADQEEENEEAGDMNDEELNALITRSEGEAEIFRQLDIQREREAVESWRNAGNRGKPPPPLMAVEELPELYRTDEPFAAKELEFLEEGRGARKRTTVNYTDGLDDDAWAMALEDGEDIEELAEKAREKKERRVQNKFLRDAVGAEGSSSRATPLSDTDSKGRRGRKKGSTNRPTLPSAADFDAPVGSKRKRAIKAVSETPSLLDDDDDERDQKRRKTKPQPTGSDIPAPVRDKMKKAFNECYRAVLAVEAEDGRKRCDLFKEVPDRREYPDYYQLIQQPIALSTLRKRGQSTYYKNVQTFKDDYILMFSNARTYNQEGSWVYNDAEEMQKVFLATFDRVMAGSGFPGAPGSPGDAGIDEDERPAPSRNNSSRSRKQVVQSDEEYLTPSDDE